MSGHSKWSTIKRQKGAADAKRGQAFTKLANSITMAVKQGGGVTDPESNFRLRLAVDRARAANMPKDNIERAILRAEGKLEGDLEEMLYEGFAPGGVAVIVSAVSDNRQRTASFIKNVFDKNGGTLASSGAVSYLFKKTGEIIVRKGSLSSDELLSKGVEAGVEDMEEEGDSVFFYVDQKNLQSTKKSLEDAGLAIESTEPIYIPMNYVTPPGGEGGAAKVLDLVAKLEELDDVQEVYTNLNPNE